ncbi:hypothetical protein [Sphingomicrobium arenosum]|uniref:hypothetical protein n=1 Tax=Sphingomicrobium arenosum TaxID=2233861 RepID=UPI002240F967|nr:hypothetical protein [Sphingomicrobium arenosum]
MKRLKSRIPVELTIIFGVITLVGCLGLGVGTARPETGAWLPGLIFLLAGLACLVGARSLQTVWVDAGAVTVRTISLARWPMHRVERMAFDQIEQFGERDEAMTGVGQRFLHERIFKVENADQVVEIQTAYLRSDDVNRLRNLLRSRSSAPVAR